MAVLPTNPVLSNRQKYVPLVKLGDCSLKYNCPLLKEVKKPARSNKSHNGHDQHAQEHKVNDVYQVNEGDANVQITLMAKLPTL